MRILQVIPYFTPKRGGDVNACYHISKELARRGHNVTILTTDFEFDKDYAKSLEKFGVKIVPVNCVMRVGLFLYSPAIKSWLKFNIKNYDVVHMHSFRSYQNNIVMKYAVIFKVPYVVQPHGSTPYIGKLPLVMLKRIYDMLWGNKIMKNAAKIIALNFFELEKIKVHFKYNYISSKIVIIPNGIDLSEYVSLPPKVFFKKNFKITEDKKVILYLGRIHKIKGIDFLIKAFSLLKNRMNFNDAILVIAGPNDGYLKNVNALAHTLGVSDSIMFVGPLFDRKKLAAYVSSDLCVLPSRYEAFGNVLLEIYACGKPVVASRVGGLKDLVIDGQTGLLFEPGNVEQLARSIYKILNDNYAAEEMGLKGNNFVRENFTMEKVVERLRNVYDEVVER